MLKVRYLFVILTTARYEKFTQTRLLSPLLEGVLRGICTEIRMGRVRQRSLAIRTLSPLTIMLMFTLEAKEILSA